MEYPMAEPSKAEKLITLLQEIESLEEEMKRDTALLGLEAATMGVGSKFVKKGMPKEKIQGIMDDEVGFMLDDWYSEWGRMPGREPVYARGKSPLPDEGAEVYDEMFPPRELTAKEHQKLMEGGFVDSPQIYGWGRRPDTAERSAKATKLAEDTVEPFKKALVAKAAQDTATGYKQLSSLALPVIPTLDALYGSYTKRSDLLKQADELKGQLSPEDLQDVERRLMEARPKYGQAAPAIRPSTEEQRKAATHKGQERPEQPVSPSSVGKGLSEEQRKQVEDFLLKMEK
jgi:hypothetical protein